MSESTAGATSQAVADLAQRLQAALGEAYAVDKPLGAGGFAVVFLVRDVQLKRRLAVKVLSPDLVTSNTVIERFRREAETVAQLAHPNIVPLHFIGQKDDLLYLAMACIDGGSLADKVKTSGPLGVEEATRVLGEVASALAHAHKRGVIHRDIKPQNVLLDGESGRALVTDFGIARTADSGSLTATGMVLGTPVYLAPEQVTGEPSDHRADIYALGVMAYEILAGRPPYEASNPTAILMKRLAGPPEPLATVRPDVPKGLSDVIDACLAIDPAERMQSAADVVRALTGHTPNTGHRTAEVRVSRKRSRMLVYALGIAAAVIVVGVVGAVVASKRAALTPAAATLSATAVDTSDMKLIAEGDYTIGSNTGPASSTHRPAHRVHLPAFRIGAHEVTVADYKVFVDSTHVPAPWLGVPLVPTLPVTRVQYAEAERFCAWRYGRGGRLAREEEWEAAARGMPSRSLPWGNAWELGRANTASASVGGPAPAPSYQYGASPEGVEDLIGNVWEWTSSPMQAYPGGRPLPDSLGKFRVIRGGAFNTPDSLATSWNRVPYPPDAPREVLQATGFRCAMNAR